MKLTIKPKTVIVSHPIHNGAVLKKMSYCEATLNLNGVEIKSNIYLS